MQGPQIVKTKSGKFRVKYYGKNGEQLAVSEVLNTRENCRKNIAAMIGLFYYLRRSNIKDTTK